MLRLQKFYTYKEESRYFHSVLIVAIRLFLMFDIYFLVFIFLFTVGCIAEIVVFNEEILLSLCFLSFVFFCFNTLSDSVADNFSATASKIESDLLVSYSSSKTASVAKFYSFLQLRGLSSKFKLLLSSILLFLGTSADNYTFKLKNTFVSIAFLKLNELVLLENNLFSSFQQTNVISLLYPLLFQTIKSSSFLTTSFLPNTSSNASAKNLFTLKSFSF